MHYPTESQIVVVLTKGVKMIGFCSLEMN